MAAIEVKNLSFVYSKKSPYEKLALDNVNVSVNQGDFIGIIGHTGSGKSTFIQHLNGLIKVQDGKITVFDVDYNVKRPKPDLRKLRSEVGMVFQYPEYQLFAETVAKDVAFGCKNIKLPTEEITVRVKEALELVGLDYDEIKDRSPFDLSGGQKRRVAIAGVIAMRPKVLILDEPTAGLDPQGKQQVLNLILTLKRAQDLTIIVISHDMDEIVRYANRIIVFNKAQIAYDETPHALFNQVHDMSSIGLETPLAVRVANKLRERGIALEGEIVTDNELIISVAAYMAEHKGAKIELDKLNKLADNDAPQNIIRDAESSKAASDYDFFGGSN